VPFRFDKPDLKPFFQQRERLSERGVAQVGISTPMVSVSHLFQFGQFLEWCLSERALIEKLIATCFERICVKLEHLLQNGVGPIFWIGGSEQATPPMMSPKLYDEFVVKYDGQLMQLIHKYGGIVHVHCHGKISGIFDRLLEMGVDMLDPVEPPPQGDIEMGEAKLRADGRITLMGNIEFVDLEFATPGQIEEKVKRALCEGGLQHTILYPSATAISRLSDAHRDNAIRYIEAGVKYGRF
jgi:uroporphyrinogen-III decarboxylase